MTHPTTLTFLLALGLSAAGCGSGSRDSGSSATSATTSGTSTTTGTSTTSGGTTTFGTVLTDDHADDPFGATLVPLVTTGLVINAGAARGVIEDPGDQDWFRVRLPGGVRFLIEVDTQQDSAVLLVAGDGRTVLTSNDDVDAAAGRLDSAVRFVPSQTADFFVVVQGGANAGPNLPTYQLSIRQN